MKKKFLFPLLMVLPLVTGCNQTPKNQIDTNDEKTRASFAEKLNKAFEDNVTEISSGLSVTTSVNIRNFKSEMMVDNAVAQSVKVSDLTAAATIGVDNIKDGKLPDASVEVTNLKGKIDMDINQVKVNYSITDALSLGLYHSSNFAYVDASNPSLAKVAKDIMKKSNPDITSEEIDAMVAGILGENGLLKIDLSAMLGGLDLGSFDFSTLAQGVNKEVIDTYLVMLKDFVTPYSLDDGGFGIDLLVNSKFFEKLGIPEEGMDANSSLKVTIAFKENGLISSYKVDANLKVSASELPSFVPEASAAPSNMTAIIELNGSIETTVDFSKGANMPNNLADYVLMDLSQILR